MNAKFIPVLLLISLGAIWGSAFILIKIAVETIPPSTVAAGRILFATIVLIAVTGFHKKIFPRDLKSWLLMFLIGIVGNIFPFYLISLAETKLDSSLVAIFMALIPFITLFLAHFIYKNEPLTIFKVFGTVMGFIGLIILVYSTSTLSANSNSIYQIFGILAAVCYAIRIILMKAMTHHDTLLASTGSMICGSIIVVPLCMIYDQPWALEPSISSVICVIILGLIPTALATIISFRLVAMSGVGYAAFTSYLVPCFGVFFGTLFLSEDLSVEKLFSLLMIILGIAITRIRPPSREI